MCAPAQPDHSEGLLLACYIQERTELLPRTHARMDPACQKVGVLIEPASALPPRFGVDFEFNQKTKDDVCVTGP